MTISFTLPALPPSSWHGVMIEDHEVLGSLMWRVCIRGRSDDSASRNWFASRDEAYAFALDRADRRHLPMFDLCGGEAE